MLNKIRMLLLPKGEQTNKRKIENLVVFIIILIVTVLLIKMFCYGGEAEDTDTSTEGVDLYERGSYEKEESLDTRLEKILSKIEGAGQVKVLITYSQTNEVVPVYNEDKKEVLTEEKDDAGGVRTINETQNKREVIYEENNGNKNIISKSVISPKIEGAIVLAQGGDDVTVKSNIIGAVEAVTGIATHKIQVFKMEGGD